MSASTARRPVDGDRQQEISRIGQLFGENRLMQSNPIPCRNDDDV